MKQQKDDFNENLEGVKPMTGITNDNIIETSLTATGSQTVQITARNNNGYLYVDWSLFQPYAIGNEGIAVCNNEGKVITSNLVTTNSGTFPTGLNYKIGYLIQYVAVNTPTMTHVEICRLTT